MPATYGAVLFPVTFAFAYWVGLRAGRYRGLALMVLVAVGWQLAAREFNPFYILSALGPWVVGQLVASRDRLRAQLDRRGVELDRERELSRENAVRLERARIARELHDIVAHCLTVTVVQAGAGERLVHTDPELARQAFADITESAEQARAEIGRLVVLLDTPLAPRRLDAVAELVAQTRATGLPIEYRPADLTGAVVPAAAVDAVYRAVQEAVTNALKHAPGAAVEVTLTVEPSALMARVVNGPAADHGLGLPALGGGHGLAGLRERFAALGGQLEAGATTGGGWSVEGTVPLR